MSKENGFDFIDEGEDEIEDEIEEAEVVSSPPEPPKLPEKEESEEFKIDFSKIKFQKIDKEEFAKRMDALNIKTYADAATKTKEIFGILQRLYGISVSTVLQFAKQSEENK